MFSITPTLLLCSASKIFCKSLGFMIIEFAKPISKI